MPAELPEDRIDREMTRAGDLRRLPAVDTNPGDLPSGADLGQSISDLAGLTGESEAVGQLQDLSQRYEITGIIGSGGMGHVLRGVDRKINCLVAIKRLRSEFLQSRKALQQFLTEATSIADLNHYNIVQVHDFGEDADGPYLVMELVEGISLAQRLDQGPLPLEEAVELTTQLAAALQAAHDQGIIHRDVKPANVLLTQDGIPKLTDFGLAWQESAETAHTQAGIMLGTLDFMSPEQRRDSSAAGPRSDQWSLAATFYQMVTGEVPRVIDSSALPESVRDCVLKALKTNPAERYQSLKAFGDALRDALGTSRKPTLDRLALAEGQCGSCGTLNSPTSRFCRGCGSALQSPCPDCGESTPVWNRFCVNCGCDGQAKLLQQLAEVETLRNELGALRAAYRHEEVLERLAPLLKSSHPTLAGSRERLTRTRDSLDHELQQLQQQREQLLQAAREQLSLGKYTTARQYLGQIQEPLQTSESRKLLEEVTRRGTRAKVLVDRIQQAVKSRQYEGLETMVEEFLALRPGDESAEKLLAKLRARSVANPTLPGVAKVVESKVVDTKEHDDQSLRWNRTFLKRKQKSISWSLLIPAAVVLVLGGLWFGLSDPTTQDESQSPPRDSAVLKIEAQEAEKSDSPSKVSAPESTPAVAADLEPMSGTIEVSATPNQEVPETAIPDEAPTQQGTATEATADSRPELLVAPFTTEEARQAQQAWSEHLGMPVVERNRWGQEFILIPPGEFTMGTTAEFAAEAQQYGCESKKDEEPARRVTITQVFQFGRHPVTVGDFQVFVEATSYKTEAEQNGDASTWRATGFKQQRNHPVVCVSHNDAMRYIEWLNSVDMQYLYRLPTEAEWEYAARSGRQTLYYTGNDPSKLTMIGHFGREGTVEVGLRMENAFGLYDLVGSAWQWCSDWYDYNYYSDGPKVDPKGPESGTQRVIRGAGWFSNPSLARFACRAKGAPSNRDGNHSFRLLRVSRD